MTEISLTCLCSVEQTRIVLQAAGVPTVPGSDGLVRNPEEAFRVAKEVIPDQACHDKPDCVVYASKSGQCMTRASLNNVMACLQAALTASETQELVCVAIVCTPCISAFYITEGLQSDAKR